MLCTGLKDDAYGCIEQVASVEEKEMPTDINFSAAPSYDELLNVNYNHIFFVCFCLFCFVLFISPQLSRGKKIYIQRTSKNLPIKLMILQ